MRRKLTTLLAAFVLFGGVANVLGADRELIVSAAASLTNAFTELGPAFERENPGVKVIFNFAASGTLLQQIDKGAPADVFASADQDTMDRARGLGLIAPETRRNFARNRLVLIVPSSPTASVKALSDLKRPEVKRIAIGDPAFVPVGRYTEEALRAAGLLEGLKPKFIPANSARQVLDYASRAEVDAGFVYATDAAVAGQKVKVVQEVGSHAPILYPLAAVAGSRQRDLAGRFIGFTVSRGEGQKILERYGFGSP